jgi:hypothetical protein
VPEETIIEIAGRQVDFKSLWPLKWRDVKELREMGVNDEDLTSGDLAAVDKLLKWMFGKLDSEITQDDIDDLSVIEIKKVTSFLLREVEELDRPSSTP